MPTSDLRHSHRDARPRDRPRHSEHDPDRRGQILLLPASRLAATSYEISSRGKTRTPCVPESATFVTQDPQRAARFMRKRDTSRDTSWRGGVTESPL